MVASRHAPVGNAQNATVLVVGDSWGALGPSWHELQDMFDRHKINVSLGNQVECPGTRKVYLDAPLQIRKHRACNPHTRCTGGRSTWNRRVCKRGAWYDDDYMYADAQHLHLQYRFVCLAYTAPLEHVPFTPPLAVLLSRRLFGLLL